MIPVDALIGSTFVTAYSAFILLFGVTAWFFFFRGARRLKKDIENADSALRKARGEARTPAEIRAEVTKNWAQLDADLSKIDSLSHAWHEFVECLILPGEGEANAAHPIRNTRDPAHYFRFDAVVGPHLNLRFYDSVPGILTGLGILGTFIGLAAGIALAQAGLTQESIAEVQEALQRLLDGASLAFATSIAGLISSILFLMLERGSFAKLSRKLAKWTLDLDRALKRETPEKVAVQQLDLTVRNEKLAREQLATHRELLNAIRGDEPRESSSSVLDQLEQQSSELKMFNTELAISIARALDEQVAQKLGPALDRIVAATEALKDQQATATEDMLQSIVDKFGETMSGAAGAEFEAIASSLRGLDDMLQQSVRAMREQEERSADAINKLSGKVAQTLSEGSTSMRKGFEESLELVLASTKSTMDLVAQRMEELTSTASTVAKESSEQLGREIGSAIGRATGELDGVTGKMSAALASAGEAASTRIDQSASGLADRADSLARALADAEVLMTRLAQASKEVQGAAGSVGTVLEGLRDVAPALKTSSGAIHEAGVAITRASTTIGGFGDAATAAVQGLGAANDRMQASWAQYVERFEGSDEALAAVVAEMEAGLQSFTDRVTEFNRSVDRDFSKAIGLLTAAIEDLDQTFDERVRT